mgnify:FL=1
MILLGYDIGSSSVKAAAVDAQTGKCLASAFSPAQEAPIKAVRPGWAEQNPMDWWQYLKDATSGVLSAVGPRAAGIGAIGISYQMHGLVCVDRDLRPLRDAIIWCDSRAVDYGQKAFEVIGAQKCLSHTLNSPGNFTAAKLAWVKENEPELYRRIYKILLPGDWIAAQLTGEARTTVSGLSEGILWDFAQEKPAEIVLDALGLDKELLADLCPTFGQQGRLTARAAEQLGLPAGIPVAYRAGDQPNNALSLNVLEPGQIASTAGTSGVVYGISDCVRYDARSRVNTFAHVNYSAADPRLGILFCLNGCGILNAWARRNFAPEGYDYKDIDSLAATVPIGSEGVSILPFGNGAERILCNSNVGCSIHGVDFNRHSRKHLLRAAQEGVAFAFRYGIDIMREMGVEPRTIHAGDANLFRSPVFRQALSGATGAVIELYDTDGAVGAARGAGIGCGVYSSAAEAFASLQRLATFYPENQEEYGQAYMKWCELLNK